LPDRENPPFCLDLDAYIGLAHSFGIHQFLKNNNNNNNLAFFSQASRARLEMKPTENKNKKHKRVQAKGRVRG
jgi:hypothetical protein